MEMLMQLEIPQLNRSFASGKIDALPDLELFGVRINNVTMKEAVCRVSRGSDKTNMTQTACFVNVNSFNLANDNVNLLNAINDADNVFADGSGVRFAAHYQGTKLHENVNGTDLLPHLCVEAVKEGKRLFLFGASPGVAQRAANNLQRMFPGLEISGTEHGYYDTSKNDALIERINTSGTDILLVALGSPLQECWIQANKYKLNITCALAVGGLFDFYSGNIPRAPLWMRQQGVEWIWRLMQEPVKKFKRYVVGNPLFLIRCLTQLKNKEKSHV
jgi:N-acetylglucosaminyldiphosphoundecaprenol N-acetyl-beta-D-mannosaminyltransferase